MALPWHHQKNASLPIQRLSEAADEFLLAIEVINSCAFQIPGLATPLIPYQSAQKTNFNDPKFVVALSICDPSSQLRRSLFKRYPSPEVKGILEMEGDLAVLRMRGNAETPDSMTYGGTTRRHRNGEWQGSLYQSCEHQTTFDGCSETPRGLDGFLLRVLDLVR